jgi:DNA topoisomerase-3
VTGEDRFVKGSADWQSSYVAQREHKFEQLERMLQFTKASGCRMLHLVSHFGDGEDSGARCGVCDVCAPGSLPLVKPDAPRSKSADAKQVSRILAVLARCDGLATGKLYLEAFPTPEVDRRAFEGMLNGLCAAGLVTVQETTFEKDGKTISYRRAALTQEGRSSGGAATTLEGIGLRTPTKKRSAVKRTSSRQTTKTDKTNRWFFVNRAKQRKRSKTQS